jgi:peptidoglycan/xylan/chitin deacetylase (PgdA/CDA1 family)
MAQRRYILTFHGLGAPPPWVGGSELSVWVERDVFERTLDDVLDRDDVDITFDDGNRSDLEIALPELTRRGLTAKFFIVAGRLGERGFLGKEDLRELAQAGMTVGSHGLHHRPWRALADADLADELGGAREQLEMALGAPVTEASCPFGEYDRRVLRHLRRTGFERVYTSDGGSTNPAAWLQARNTIGAQGGRPIERVTAPDGPRAALLRTAKRVAKRWR